MKQRIIDEKLEKLGLGIEKRPEFAHPVPEIHAAHARATSVCFYHPRVLHVLTSHSS